LFTFVGFFLVLPDARETPEESLANSCDVGHTTDQLFIAWKK